MHAFIDEGETGDVEFEEEYFEEEEEEYGYEEGGEYGYDKGYKKAEYDARYRRYESTQQYGGQSGARLAPQQQHQGYA